MYSGGGNSFKNKQKANVLPKILGQYIRFFYLANSPSSNERNSSGLMCSSKICSPTITVGTKTTFAAFASATIFSDAALLSCSVKPNSDSI
ncbi:hypothetical protein AX24_02705 [Listeria monocytogenes WSLC1042]|nr:hypothetical protein AX24_02705 [Listeria monocytogenes WSLC1042]